MADTSSIDLVALIEQRAAIRFSKPVSRNEKQTQKGGPCPFCGLGEDRFAVFINEVPQHYYCGIHGNGCGAHGDALTFVRECLLIDNYYEACELLDIEPDSQYAGPAHRNSHTDNEPPCKKWQEQAEEFSLQCKSLLWSEEGLPALNWLRARGLDDSIINFAGLGLNLTQGHRDAKEWGEEKDLWIDRGIIIPWSVGGAVWKVNIRRSDKDIARENARLRAQGRKANAAKYRQVRGGTNGLYNVDVIQPGQPLVLVEGEFDCLATLQATDRQVAVVATGSTGNGRGQRWIKAIEQAEPILIAFDDDENKAGDNAATFWDERISQAIRWTPWSHDINDMLLRRSRISRNG
jgi:DNA primase